MLEDSLISLLNGLAIGLLLFMLSVGPALILGLMGTLNLAHGATFALGSYLAWWLVGAGGAFLLAVPLALAAGALLGLLLAAGMRPLGGRDHLDQALVTLGFALVLAGIISAVWGDDFHTVRPPAALRASVHLPGGPYPVYRLAVIAGGLMLALALEVVIEHTRLGRIVKAAAHDRAMLSALGIDVGRVFFLVMAAGTALAAAAGVAAAPVLNVRPGLDDEVLLLALIVLVVGGLGSVRGALLGAVLIGEVQTLSVRWLPAAAPFVLFGAMALTLLLRPAGLTQRGPA